MTPPSPTTFPFNIIETIEEFFSEDGQVPVTPPQCACPPDQAPVTPPPFQPPETGITEDIQDFFRGLVREIPRAFGPITAPVRHVPALWQRGLGIAFREGSTFLPEHMPSMPNSAWDWVGLALGLPLLGMAPLGHAGIAASLVRYLGQSTRQDNQNISDARQVMVLRRMPGQFRLPEAQEEILECR